MGVYAGPKIVDNNNLSFSIDFANTKSYIGSGLTVTSQIGNVSSNFSIKDNFYKVYDLEVADFVIPNAPESPLPTFNSSNLGYINFRQSNGYLDFSIPNVGNVLTIEMWIKLETNYSDNIVLSFGDYTVGSFSGGLGFNTSNGDLYGISSTNVSTLGLIENWKHYVFEMRSDISYSNNKIYINGQQQTITSLLGSESSSNRNFNGGSGRIASWSKISGYEMPMDLSLIRIYNNSLTASKVLENFNSNRGRFSV